METINSLYNENTQAQIKVFQVKFLLGLSLHTVGLHPATLL